MVDYSKIVTNYIYLLQEREFIKTNENIFKIGMTQKENHTRFNQYPKGSILLFQIICQNCIFVERKIKEEYKNKFIHRKDIGNEYFEGNVEEMINLMYNTRNKYNIHTDIKSTFKNNNDILNKKKKPVIKTNEDRIELLTNIPNIKLEKIKLKEKKLLEKQQKKLEKQKKKEEKVIQEKHRKLEKHRKKQEQLLEKQQKMLEEQKKKAEQLLEKQQKNLEEQQKKLENQRKKEEKIRTEQLLYVNKINNIINWIKYKYTSDTINNTILKNNSLSNLYYSYILFMQSNNYNPIVTLREFNKILSNTNNELPFNIGILQRIGDYTLLLFNIESITQHFSIQNNSNSILKVG